MDGIINAIKYDSTMKGRTYVVSGVNKLEYLMNNIFPMAHKSSDGWTASTIIGYIVDQVNDMNDDSKDYWTNIGKDITATTLEVNYYEIDKPAYHHIETLSTNEYTGNGTYIYYLDSSNQLVWKPRPTDDAGSETGTVTEGNETFSIRIEKGVWGVINALMINCGVDYSGRKITTFKVNSPSVGKHGFKWKYVGKTGFASNYIDANPSGDDNDVRAAARADAKAWADEVLEKLGAARYRATVEVRGNSSYVKGDIWKLQTNTFTFSTGNKYYNLRLTNIRHNYSGKEGWITTLEFEEDEDTALENL